jgi:type I restriction enzyme S subunit
VTRYQAYSEYKDSGLQWLGPIPTHWELMQSRRLFAQRKERARQGDEQLTASQKYGVIYQKLFMELEGQSVVQVFTGADILKHVEKNDFVISMRSFQGGLELCSYPGCVSSAYVGLIPIKHVRPEFFKYLFKCSPYIQALQSTSNLVRDGQALRFENFSQVHLPCVPDDEQKKIAAFLDHETAKIDALIEKQQRLIELLKEKRQAVISHAVTKGLKLNAPMKDSGVDWLGEVPAHWKVKKLKYLVDEPLMYGANEAAIDNNPNNPRFIRITDVNDDGSLRADTFCSLSEGIAAQFLLKEGDVLLARTGGTVGKSFLYANTWGKCCFAGYLIKASLNQQIVLAEWFYQYAQTRYYWDWIDSVQIQATLPNVSAEKYNGFFVPTPPINEQMNIVAEIRRRTDKFDVLIAAAEQAVAYIKERRTALISAAVTGKIDVRDWQAAA